MKKDSVTNVLYLDCKSLLKNNEADIARNIFNMCFISEESNILVLFDSKSLKRSEIEHILNQNKVKSVIVDFHAFREEEDISYEKNEEYKQEYHFARNTDQLLDCLRDSFRKGLASCTYDPEVKLASEVGYIDSKGE